MIRNILVPLTPEMSSDALLNAALSVAKGLNGHIRALFVQPHPDAAFAYLPDVILAAGVTREVNRTRDPGSQSRGEEPFR